MTDDLRAIAERVIDLVADRAEAQVNVVGVDSGLTRFANSFIHQHVGDRSITIDLKVAVGSRVASSTTTRVAVTDLDGFVDDTIEMARLSPADPSWPGLAPPQEIPPVDHASAASIDASPDARAQIVRDFVAAGPELSAAGYADTDHTRHVLMNTAGHEAIGQMTRATLDGIHQSADAAGYGHVTSTSLDDLDGAATGARAAELARRSSEADDIEPGRYEVVLSPECVAMSWLFMGLYGFNAKQVEDGQSFARVGEAQFDDSLAVFDDGAAPSAIGLPYDYEGTAKRRIDLVRAGTTAALAHDRRTAAAAGTESTGHAIKGGESWGAFPSNLFIAPGDRPVEELIAGVGRGLLVTSFNYCRVLDPKTMVTTGLTRNGTFLIERGRIIRPVTNLRFTQSFSDAFGPGRVAGIGNDARFAGTEEFGTGLVHAPSVHLSEWNFTGGAQG